MANKLFDLFCNHLKTFGELLKGTTKNEDEQLLSFVNEAEGKKEFEELVKVTQSSFTDHHDEWYDYKGNIKNYFCNSKCYIDLFNGKKPNIEGLFDSYLKEFQKQEDSITLIAMIEFVDFADELMDFGSFQIRKYSTNELSTLLRNEINKIFYPWAYIDTNKLNKLENQWFICISAPKNIVSPGKRIRPSCFLEPVERKYTKFPKPLESVLKYLTLFEWKHTPDASSQGFTFNIPLILQINESLLAYPTVFSDIPVLETTIVGDQNEQIEIPALRFKLNSSETEQFKNFIADVKNYLDNLKIQENHWEFFETAYDYFYKGFFFEGIEQLLWHVIVIEALIGEKGKGITARLKRRIAKILGNSDKMIFEKLYDFRCDLVHGNVPKKEVFTNHLFEARELSRQVLFWFLNYLNTIQNRSMAQPEGKLPTREELLKLIDESVSIRKLTSILSKLPECFPDVSEWKT